MSAALCCWQTWQTTENIVSHFIQFKVAVLAWHNIIRKGDIKGDYTRGTLRGDFVTLVITCFGY